MSQIMSVRTNQNFNVDYESGKLIPQTEVIVLVEQPKYVLKKDEIIRNSEVTELRFTCRTDGLNLLIGKLQMAELTASKFEQMSSALNEIIVASKPKDPSAPTT